MSNETKFFSGEQNFRPRARLISVLGEQLIKDGTVGLLELVKNGYDADASLVKVSLLNLTYTPNEIKNKKGLEQVLKRVTIVVEDDGIGMDLDDVLKKWLEPATGHKENSKKKNARTPQGRLPLGEKGVGRFATHKLGRHLELISRKREANGELSESEVVVKIPWDRFDDEEEYLTDIGVTYSVRPPEHFHNKSGTKMIMTHSRSLWKESDVKDVSNILRRLMSPFRTPKSFTVELYVPDYKKYEDLKPGEILNTSHAELTALVDETGFATYEYEFKIKRPKKRKVKAKKIDLRLGIEDWKPASRSSRCGSFFVTFYIWDRSSGALRNTGATTKELNEYNGVSVFRDGIRVLPYGGPEDDWLEIDQVRYMKTSEAISRKNIIAAVEINQETNSQLRDKSNREGFIENDAFLDFKELLIAIVNIVHNEFSDDRRRMRELENVERKEMIPAITQLEQGVEKVKSSLSEVLQMASSFSKKGEIKENEYDTFQVLVEEAQQILDTSTSETRAAAAEALEAFDEERETLFSLAGLGLAAEKFTHEFARLTSEGTEIIHSISRASEIRNFPNIVDQAKSLEIVLDTLQDLVQALGPLFYIRQKTRIGDYRAKSLIENAILLNQREIRLNKIDVEIVEVGEKLFVHMRRSNLIQVFNNLIDNSCYWLERNSEEMPRKILITILSDEGKIIIADNGPGIPEEDRHRIFNAFFTKKNYGRGLGLYIAREVLEENQATINLLNGKKTEHAFNAGVAFEIQLPEETYYTEGK